MDQNSVFDPAQVGELKQKTVWFFSQSHYQAWLENAPLIDHNQPQPAAHIDAPEKPKKKKPISIGKIIRGIIIVIVIFWVFYNLIAPMKQPVSESCELDEILPLGTWETADGSMQFVTHSDGSISWTDGTETATDSDPSLVRVNLTEENAPDLKLESDLEHYPISEYTHYNLCPYDASTDLPNYILHIYLANDIKPEDITQFDCYDAFTKTYFTLHLVSES